MQEQNSLQTELMQSKSKGFDLYQQLENAGKHIQALEGSINHMASIVGFKDLASQGVTGLIQFMEQATAPKPKPKAYEAEEIQV